jgi:hypothetical protein
MRSDDDGGFVNVVWFVMALRAWCSPLFGGLACVDIYLSYLFYFYPMMMMAAIIDHHSFFVCVNDDVT